MKTRFFFTASTLLLAAATNFFCVSCKNDDKDEFDSMSEYVEKEKQSSFKIIEATAVIAEDIYDFYDVKAIYEYEGEKTEDLLNDMNETIEITDYSRKGPFTLKFREYRLIKEFGKAPVDVTIVATPKPDAIAKLESMPDDTVLNYLFGCQIEEKMKVSSYNEGYEMDGARSMEKRGVIKFMGRGDKMIGHRSFN